MSLAWFIVWMTIAAPGAGPTVRQGGPASATRGAGTLLTFDEGEGRPIVMLGGGTLGALAFAPHARELSKNFRVVRLQTMNVERSSANQPLPEGYSVRMESDAMVRSLDRIGLTGPVDVVGHSFGALVALDFALGHPERVRTLALAEPPAFWAVPEDERRRTPAMAQMLALLGELQPESRPTDDQLARFRCLLGSCAERAPGPADPAAKEWAERRASLRGLSVVAALRDYPAGLEAFPKPVLILTGSETVAFHRRINDILAAALRGGERAEVPGGHGAPYSARAEFLSRLEAFLARHGGRQED